MKCKLSKLFFLALVGAISVKGYSQLRSEETYKVNSDVLLKNLIEENILKNEKALAKAYEVAAEKNLPKEGTYENGVFYQITGYDFDNDQIIYYATSNNGPNGSLQTSRAQHLQSGGSLGLNLNGQGMIVGIWDGGLPRATHTDVSPRVVIKDNSNTVHYHAAHVAGTMVSAGLTDTKTKGYAPQAYLWANDWNNDDVEMAAQASSGQGLLLSNHSYGYDYNALQLSNPLNFYRMGSYDNESRGVDQILFAAPNYLAVHAAGNDRDAVPAYNNKGGNDLLTGTGTSKNNVVVGAVLGIPNYTSYSNVVPTTFTNYGPTDDFRIKPDIATKGYQVFSNMAEGNSDNDYLSGTSMAAPGVTGVFVLWQQYFKQLWPTKNNMKAASVKALMAHTADPATINGAPDHRFGWGLINAKKGAEVLKDVKDNKAMLIEGTLANGEVKEYTFQVEGDQKIVATLAWTDPAGVVNNSLDSSVAVLVNDLDLRIVRPNGQMAYPWALNKDFNNLYATNGLTTNIPVDNNVDVIEKVEYFGQVTGVAVQGVYTIRVSHKGSLVNGAQNFSLIVTGRSTSALSNDKVSQIASLKMFPNPAQDSFQLSGDISELEGAKVVIYDLLGKKVFENGSLFEFSSDATIDISGYSAGVYVVEISKGNVKDVRKLIKK